MQLFLRCHFEEYDCHNTSNSCWITGVPTYCDDLNHVDELISKIIKPLFNLNLMYNFVFPFVPKVFLKAKERTLKDNENYLTETSLSFSPICSDKCNFVVGLIIIV